MQKAIELKTTCKQKVLKHKQLGEQGDLHNWHCEADNVHTALHVHFTNFLVCENNSTP